MSQFSFLKAEFADVHALSAQAESIAHSDPRGSCVYARLALETAVNWLYRHDATLKAPYERTLSARIHEPTFRALAGEAIVAKARLVKNLGNAAAHEPKPVPFKSAATALRELFHVAYWLVRTYGRGTKPAPSLAFSQDALPRTATIPAATLIELQAAAQRFVDAVQAQEQAEAQRQASEAGRTVLEAELEALRAEVAAAKAANARVPDTHDYDEAATRDYFIDKLLAEAGWTFTRPGHDTEYPVTGMPNNKTGTGYVDYVLWGDDGKPLGLVEAKRTTRDAREGQQQAKLYADCLEKQTGRRPVIFYTNGYEHHVWDDVRYPPRAIQGFLTKDELELAIRRRTEGFLRPLGPADIDPAIVERPYQLRAIRRVTEAFEKDKARKALLVMATGSGKTRTVVALSDLMMRTNWARRILFLADRVALVNQSVKVYKQLLPSSPPVNLITDRDSTGRIYVSTYPTMMRLIDETREGRKRFGPGHFDLIVIDEAHRSVYRKYGAIFAYFDSLLIGLTATPKDEIDRDTYRLFDLQRGVPTDAYGLDDAVKDGFLVPPRAVSVPTKFMRDGITYDQLSKEEKEAWDAIEWSEEGEPAPDRVEPAALNQWLFNKDTVDKVLEHLMTHGLKVAGGDRLGKTIIFAKNHNHAHFIVERFDANYPHLKGSFARVIDNQTEQAQSLIDDFGEAEKAPHIAVSVDMLDTGIDVPEVANLVFFKIVRSKTKFWQMLGRGTRLCPDLFGPGRHKEHFQVFDFCQNLEFFNQSLPETGGAVAESLAKRLFSTRVDLIADLDAAAARTGTLAEAAAPYGPSSGPGAAPQPDPGRQLRSDTVGRLVEEVAAMSLDNFLVRPKRRYVEKFAKPEAWSKKLGLDDRSELTEHLAGLPSALVDNDLAAKQFDLLLLRTQLAVLRNDPSLGSRRQQVVAIAAALQELANVPSVAAEMELILEVQSDEYWTDITAPMLETVRRRLRSLVGLIGRNARHIVYTDFEDEIGAGAAVGVQGLGPGTDMDRFRLKARHFLKDHESHITILKLKRNEPLTAVDLAELEKMFLAAGFQSDEIAQARSAGGLGLFVRSLVGLEREAAKQAFAQFTAGKNLSANQLEFVNLIIDHLTERGAMDPRLLYEAPFTDKDSMGISGLFSDRDVAEVVSILDAVRKRAAA